MPGRACSMSHNADVKLSEEAAFKFSDEIYSYLLKKTQMGSVRTGHAVQKISMPDGKTACHEHAGTV